MCQEMMRRSWLLGLVGGLFGLCAGGAPAAPGAARPGAPALPSSPDALGSVTTFTYCAGQLRWLAPGEGQVLTYSYDGSGRLLTAATD